MPTTTNYGWTTPADTDLVKDGASAIRTLGTAIDTTVFNNASAAVQKSVVDAAGDLLIGTANDTVGKLAIGTANQQLRVNSGATSLEYFTPASAGGMTLISETVASSNTDINLTSIPGTYKQLLLVFTGLYPSGSSSGWSARFNNNSTAGAYQGVGKSYTTNYSFDNATNVDNWPNSGLLFGYNGSTSSTDFSSMANGSLLIDNYASTSKYKFYQAFSYSKEAAVSQRYLTNLFGVFTSTSAITSLDIVRVAGSDTLSNASNTSIRLYGIS